MLDDALTLFPEHKRLAFYTWGARRLLPAEGRDARDARRPPRASPAPGDVLVFEETAGPRTGAAADADPTHRHAVRLTSVTPTQDPLGGRFARSPTNDRQPTSPRSNGAARTRCPFPLCVSATVPDEGGTIEPRAISVALGNIVLADHGRSCDRRPRRSRAGVDAVYRVPVDAGPCAHSKRRPGPGALCAAASRSGRSRRRRRTIATQPAADGDALDGRRRDAGDRADDQRPATPVPWQPRRDLLGSSETATDFVVEVEHDLEATLRFGDDVHGRRPRDRHDLHRAYRVGNGVARQRRRRRDRATS